MATSSCRGNFFMRKKRAKELRQLAREIAWADGYVTIDGMRQAAKGSVKHIYKQLKKTYSKTKNT
jgi:hypothetical protein